MRILVALATLILGLARLTWAQTDSASSHCAAVVARVLADTSLHPAPPDLTAVPMPGRGWPKDARDKPILVRFRVQADGRADLATLELAPQVVPCCRRHPRSIHSAHYLRRSHA